MCRPRPGALRQRTKARKLLHSLLTRRALSQRRSAMRQKLEAPELGAAMARLSGWELADGKLRRTFRFRDFADAFAFMTACALRIEKLDHHPEWSNVYS